MVSFAPGGAPRSGPVHAHGPVPEGNPSGIASVGPGFACAGRTEPQELERLGDEIARLSAHISAATYRLLCLIREFDERQGWQEEGFRNCARWLSWRTGIAPGAAREKLRVARALGRLPALSEALRTGELSYSAARALTRVATPENEAELVEVARHVTAAQLERLVGGWRALDRAADLEAERDRHRERALWVVPEADGSWAIRGRLDPEVGAALCRALEAATEQLYAGNGSDRAGQAPAEHPDAQSPPEARRADALGLLAEAALGRGLGRRAERKPGTGARPAAERSSEAGSKSEAETGAKPPSSTPAPVVGRAERVQVVGRAERFQVVVHVEAATLTEETGHAGESRIEGGPHVSAETSRRIACDASKVVMTHDRAGNVLDVGRRTRTVPPALRRALNRRDGGCRFPGCTCRFCDAHHLRHWADGGETKLENLALLCRRHHRLLHEEGWRAEWGEDGELRFYRPDGRPLPRIPAPPELREEVRRDPVAALVREQRTLGIRPRTPTPRWTGDRLDLDWALFTLYTPREPDPAADHCRDRSPASKPDVSAETPGQSAAAAGLRAAGTG